MHIGNPKPISANSAYYDTGKTIANCWAMINTQIDSDSTTAVFTGLFNWCRTAPDAGVTDPFKSDSTKD